MRIERLLTWITPLMLGALLGLYEILPGLFYVVYGTPDQKRDYPLEIVLGLRIKKGWYGNVFRFTVINFTKKLPGQSQPKIETFLNYPTQNANLPAVIHGVLDLPVDCLKLRFCDGVWCGS